MANRPGLCKNESPEIGGVKMKKLGKNPGSYKKLVHKHLGKSPDKKITKSDGDKIIALAKKKGDKELARKGSFIKNVIAEGPLDKSGQPQYGKGIGGKDEKKQKKAFDRNKKRYAKNPDDPRAFEPTALDKQIMKKRKAGKMKDAPKSRYSENMQEAISKPHVFVGIRDMDPTSNLRPNNKMKGDLILVNPVESDFFENNLKDNIKDPYEFLQELGIHVKFGLLFRDKRDEKKIIDAIVKRKSVMAKGYYDDRVYAVDTNENRLRKTLENYKVSEDVQELSKKTLGSYISKASDSRRQKQRSLKKQDKSIGGIKRASSKLDENDKALANKAKESGEPLGVLKKVYKRGLAAYASGHRPGMTQHQWAMARVNSYIKGGKARTVDKDLREHRLTFKEFIAEHGIATSKESLENWEYKDAKEYAELLVKTFGEPDYISRGYLGWNSIEPPFDKVWIMDESVPHDYPAPHRDYVYSSMIIPLKSEMMEAISHASGSIIVDGLKNKVTARCGTLYANAATLGFVKKIADGEIDYSDKEKVKKMYANAIQKDPLPEWYPNTLGE